MSIKIVTRDSDFVTEANPCSGIKLIIQPKQHDLGGFSVRRALPGPQQKMVGPWIFFDHMGPANFSEGQGIDVRPHPHINLATVTYLFEGEMYHRDSLGNALAIQPGEINLMVAGRGIVHSERQRDEIKARPHRLDGLQLWLALPEADEETDPAFHHYDASDIPQVDVNSVPVRVLIGSAYGVTSPVRTFANTLYVEARLRKGQTFDAPGNVEQMAVYIVTGNASINGTVLDKFSMAVIDTATPVTIEAHETTQLAIIGGEKLSDRHIWWNFVSSRKDRIEQAKDDWKAGRFAKVPGDEEEFIPLPED